VQRSAMDGYVALGLARCMRQKRVASARYRFGWTLGSVTFPCCRVIMKSMADCELCEMDREFCEHGLAERRRADTQVDRELRISPRGMAHFPGCPHKGDDPDYRRWATLDTPRAWERLGNGEQLLATGGERPGLVARSRCQDCVSHGPW
jgi:hypothetical protein